MQPRLAPEQRKWWDHPAFAAAIVLAMAVPLLWPDIPPLVDLMGHMGRYKVQLDLHTSPYLARYYDFTWGLIGNLGVDLLVMPLGRLFGVEAAVKLIVILIPVLSAVGVIWISREVHGRFTPAALLALPFVYGHPFQFGFVNFALGIALCLLAFAFWLRLGRTGALRLRAWLFVPIGLILWVTHSFAWGVLGLLCFSADTVRERDAGRGWIAAAYHAGLHCLSLAPPALLMVLWRAEGVQGETGDWFNWGTKQIWLITTLRDRWEVFDLASLGFAFVAFLVILLRKEFEISRNLGASAIVLGLAFLCLPKLIFGSAYADMRLLPYVWLVLFLAIRPAAGAGVRAMTFLALAGLAFLGVRLAGHTASYVLYDRLHDRTLAMLDKVPRGARLLTFVGRQAGIPWYTDRQEHLPAMAIVRREAFSNDQWVAKGAQLLSIRKSDARGFDRDPTQLMKPLGERREPWHDPVTALKLFPRSAFDYLWLVTPQPYDPALIADLELVARNGRDSLWRIPPAVQPATANSDMPKGSGTLPRR
jgi:hypothetical protein